MDERPSPYAATTETVTEETDRCQSLAAAQQPHGLLATSSIGVRAGVVAAALAVALLSFFLFASHFSVPETYAGALSSLDEKKATVTGLVAASTAASAAITLLPGDVGSPIATKLVDLSSDFLVVLAAIYLEKYLLTTLGFAAFKVLIPIGCVFVIAATLLATRMRDNRVLMRLAAKFALLGVALVLLVPTSVFISDMIENTYQASIDETIQNAEQAVADIETEARGNSSIGESGASEGILGVLGQVGETITGEVGNLVKQAQDALSNLVEALAVMVVTSCVIPILVLLFFLWLIKVILGVNVAAPAQALKPRALGRRAK